MKNISNLPFSYHFSEGRHNGWRKISVSGRPLYLFDIPVDAIREVYLGQHIYKNVSKRQSLTHEELLDLMRSWQEKDFLLRRCEPDINTWNLLPQEVVTLE
ncbi:MAG: hypothetical protein ACPG51_19020 [Thiolinea sp.]